MSTIIETKELTNDNNIINNVSIDDFSQLKINDSNGVDEDNYYLCMSKESYNWWNEHHSLALSLLRGL